MTPRELRWYGWGYDDTTFSFDDRPGAWDYLSARLDLGDDHVPVASLDSIRLRPSRLDEAALQALREIVGAEAVAATDSVRELPQRVARTAARIE